MATSPRLVVEDAFKRFELLIRPSDDRMFKQTSLEDVKKAALIISRDQSQRNCLRNLSRMKPLFDLLNKLSGPIETLCQGVPYLCYIWAPIKLLLQIADEYSTGFDKLVDAYVQIAQHLPRFDRLNHAFSDQPGFQSVLADIYSDILEFHSHAYRFLRRGGWKILFDASWRNFGTRFNGILRRLDQGRELLDKEAASFNILESKDFRHKILEDLDKRERERHEWQMRDTLLWLDLKGQDREQDELMDHRIASRQPNTCAWILSHPKVTSWLDDEHSHPFMWLNGKPGSGKTTLATFLVEEMTFPPKAMVLYCLCSYGFGKSESNACSLTLRSLVAQIVRSNPDLLPYVYDNYVKVGAVNGFSKTRTLLRDLLRASEITYLVIDGMDECEQDHQKQILNEMFNLAYQKGSEESANIKILVCSRETPEITRRLGRVPKLSLNDVKEEVERDITTFTMSKLVELHGLFDDETITEIGQEIVRKANGMFLWVQLVMSSLIDQGSVQDLRRSVSRLPADLRGVYKSILDRIQRVSDEDQQKRIQFVLGLLASSYRPLKAWEVCDLIVFHEQADAVCENNKLTKSVLNVCKPFIEELEDGNVHIVHFSAREFLFEKASGPYIIRIDLHRQITVACTRYLLTCNRFLEHSLELKTVQDMVRGYHDLFPYVYEYWTIHLEQAEAQDLDGDLVLQQLSGLSHKLAVSIQPLDIQSHGDVAAYVPRPIALPPMIRQYIAYRKRLVQKQRKVVTNSDTPVEDTLMDPTTLTQAHANYLKVFENLLEENSELSQRLANEDCDPQLAVLRDHIDDFRSRHGSRAFMCRWSGCIWASTGFRNLAERQRHEESHIKRFKCPEADCDSALGGFSSKRALKLHKEKYHTTVDSVELPPLLAPLNPQLAPQAMSALLPGRDSQADAARKSSKGPVLLQLGQFTDQEVKKFRQTNPMYENLPDDSIRVMLAPSSHRQLSPPPPPQPQPQKLQQQRLQQQLRRQLQWLRQQQQQLSQRLDKPEAGQQLTSRQLNQLMVLEAQLKQQERMTVAQLSSLNALQEPTQTPPPFSRAQSFHIDNTNTEAQEKKRYSLQDHATSSITREDNLLINQRAAELAKGTSKEKMRNIVQNMSAQIRGNLAQKGIDPIIYYFKDLATQELREGKLQVDLTNIPGAGKPSPGPPGDSRHPSIDPGASASRDPAQQALMPTTYQRALQDDFPDSYSGTDKRLRPMALPDPRNLSGNKLSDIMTSLPRDPIVRTLGTSFEEVFMDW